MAATRRLLAMRYAYSSRFGIFRAPLVAATIPRAVPVTHHPSSNDAVGASLAAATTHLRAMRDANSSNTTHDASIETATYTR